VAAEDRVSDAERERIVRDLTKHCGDGRLTLDELEERVAEVYAATNVAQIQHALRELPRSPVPMVKPSGPPVRTKPSDAPVRHSAGHGAEIALKVHLAVYLSVMALLVLIYALTMLGGYFWPIWPAMGWGTAVAIQAGITKAITVGR
jgi:hypothetical protein